MIDTDPPLHTELRRLVSAPFAVRTVRDYEELVRSVSRQVLAGALAQDRFDFVERVAAAVPIKVLCRLLGVPEEDEGLLINLGDQMIANTDPDLASVLLDGGESEQYRLLPFRSPAALEMFEYSRRLSEARRPAPLPGRAPRPAGTARPAPGTAAGAATAGTRRRTGAYPIQLHQRPETPARADQLTASPGQAQRVLLAEAAPGSGADL